MSINSTAVSLGNITYITMEIFIGLCAIVGNVLVIWVVKLNPSLQTTTFYFIGSLALADIAVGMLVMPLAIVISLGITIHFYSCLFMTCLLLIFTHASIMSLLAIAVDRYLRVKLNVRFGIPVLPGCILSIQWMACLRRVMWLVILLPLTLFSDAMVMDEKVKESFVLDTASAICSYNARYKDHRKYWCRGYFRDYCNIIAFSPNSTNHVALRDTGNQLIVTMSCLAREDTGWYWCGIQRDFARDYMDFTELIVTDNKGTLANDFWSGKDLPGNKTRSCKAPKVVHEADHSRTSILIICILITGLGIISIISHLTKRRRSQRNRRIGNSLKPFSRILTPKNTAPTEQM
ncbi:transmembrane domain-containing protein TMIGD3 isoform X1 [Sapajus apella]|uniref:Transmembrane domain-containing protein TMIGD3 isoform X1 n=1 Tax=Sapajus apella TaxID=9515 RepID=A0A6J3FIY5_SAPAP|nr:transmembrane domain-containing protein TMIGD3 isoform X1 [Sapajus apella]XP_032105658.1 transmembrane domain-containing protein TMIGD3 isoform X1 [Sapajus apella]